MATTVSSETVTIPCPRCDGRGGRSSWMPDRGICYRCGGRGEVHFNAARHLAALRFLRAKYRRIQEAMRHGDPLAVEALRYCIQDGLRVRRELEAQGIEVK